MAVDNTPLTEDELIKTMELIQGAYPNCALNENNYRSFYYFLKDYGRNDVWIATKQWIETNAYPPTVHGIVTNVKEIIKQRALDEIMKGTKK